MLIRIFSKLIVFVGPLIILGYTFLVYLKDGSSTAQVIAWSTVFTDDDEIASHNSHGPEPSPMEVPVTFPNGGNDNSAASQAAPEASSPLIQLPLPLPDWPVDQNGDPIVNPSVHREVFSVSTMNGKYFALDFGPDFPVINPNIIPHPRHTDTWIMVAQREKSLIQDGIFEELVCNAKFRKDGTLACSTPAALLPVAPTHSDKCKDALAHFTMSFGPHDMRVFYGPDAPYTVSGSQSAHTCFGLWTQDLRTLVDDFGLESLSANLFKTAVEIQRPPPWSAVEKNWFLFWDSQGNVYAHHDIAPKRVFAQLSPDGSIGPDLAPLAASDEACMAKYMPKPAPIDENLHQATNSLAITLCKRTDSTCKPSAENTFIMTIFHHKTFHSFHGMYEPYIMLFQQNAPFAVHAISQKPVWLHGRGVLTKESNPGRFSQPDQQPPKGHTEMLYVTSMSWKAHGQKYHGYIDDVLFLGFGIEDARAAAIDIMAGDLLQDLGLCSSVGV